MEGLAKKPGYWPKALTLTAPLGVPGGQVLPIGTVLKVIAVRADGIEVENGAGAMVVQAKLTDIESRVQALLKQAMEKAQQGEQEMKRQAETARQEAKQQMEAAKRDAAKRAQEPAEARGETEFLKELKQNLQRLEVGSLRPYPEAEAVAGFMKQDYFLLYFNADNGKGSRAFTESLKEFYQDVRSRHPEFEIIFISSDDSAKAMEKLVTETAMPWPMLAFEEGKNSKLTGFAGRTLPHLCLLDRKGEPLSRTDADENNPDNRKVLTDILAILEPGGK